MDELNERIAEFNKFRESAEDIFKPLAEKDASNKRLDKLYTLNIAPGGSMGGQKKRLVEVFYGSRAIGIKTVINSESKKEEVALECANGAKLLYFRLDDGNVISYLTPAGSENMKSVEEYFILDYIKDPSLAKLQQKATLHWKYFVSYMAYTCIGGDPSLKQRYYVFILKNFKRYIVNKVEQEKKYLVLLKKISTLTFSLLLSGSFLSYINFFGDRHTEQQHILQFQQERSTLVGIRENTHEISKILSEIGNELKQQANFEKLSMKNIEEMLDQANGLAKSSEVSLDITDFPEINQGEKK